MKKQLKITDVHRREFEQYKSSYYAIIRELKELYAEQAAESIIHAKEIEAEEILKKLIIDSRHEDKIRAEGHKILFS